MYFKYDDPHIERFLNHFSIRKISDSAILFDKNIDTRINSAKDEVSFLKEELKRARKREKDLIKLKEQTTEIHKTICKYFGEDEITSRRLLKEI